jgi:hypothetical protein
MKYRISYYRMAEIDEGRAPRIMVDIDANSLRDAVARVKKRETGTIEIRSAYNAPNKPIPENPSYIYLSGEAREKWYKRYKAEQHANRICKTCKKQAVERYQRECSDCKAKKKAKHCMDCGKEIKSRRRCDECAQLHTIQQRRLAKATRILQASLPLE